MILEGIITTCDLDDGCHGQLAALAATAGAMGGSSALACTGGAHIAPMGPVVDADMRHLLLRPFQTSTTFKNLKRTGQGVFHVTDDVELLARAAVGQPGTPPLSPCPAVEGWILSRACRWYAFRVTSCDDSQPRAEMTAEVVGSGRLRDFFGFNRAKHAVVEAAILATRLEFIETSEVAAEFDRLRVLVQKTGGEQEHRAMQFLDEFVRGGTGKLDQPNRSRHAASQN